MIILKNYGAREIALWLRALATDLEELDSKYSYGGL